MTELELLRQEVAAMREAINDMSDILRNHMKVQADFLNVKGSTQEWCNWEIACTLLSCKKKKLYSLVDQGKVLSSNTGGKTHRLYNVKSIKKYISDSSKVTLIKQ
jgi:hypothetical protein